MILAHGAGGGAALPAEPWLLAYSAAFALLIASVALRLLWPAPRLATAAEGVVAPAVLDTASRVIGSVLQALVLLVFVGVPALSGPLARATPVALPAEDEWQRQLGEPPDAVRPG